MSSSAKEAISIDQLPEEVLLKTFENLNSEDLKNSALVCNK